MFNLYNSNEFDALLILLSCFLNNKKENPLDEEIIIVQNMNIAHWIKIFLAEKTGISANLKFFLPSTFIWKIVSKIFPKISLKNTFNRREIAWRIMRILPNLVRNKKFYSIKNYLKDKKNVRKYFQFSQKVSELFDEYLIYRPDWMYLWNMNKCIFEIKDKKTEEWQSYLWRKICKESLNSNPHFWDRSSMYIRSIKFLEKKERILNLPKRIFFLIFFQFLQFF
ncbi:hypothetical protein AOQ89_01435 [bacterium endosymbiont of Pedicinus badii]|nr:exodeoxyribonuclease V subunit gamma [bacterium endosymbiont of Pedicinus badii]OQM34007.1 hypothetical protein AOQ89_01435 [bacterium endosymbiont of Pedicinus badii]